MDAGSRFVELERRTRKVSVAFFFYDDFTGGRAEGVRVAAAGDGWKAFPNRSGYHVLTDMPEGRHEFLVEAPGYQPVKEEFDLKQAGMPYVFSRGLVPLPAYPFPDGATLIRGTVLEEGTATALGQVTVGLTIFGKTLKAATADDGAFVLYLTGLNEKRTARKNGKLLVSDERNTEFSLAFSKPGYTDASGKIVLVKEGAEEESEKFAWEVGTILRIRKHLTKGG